VAKAIGTKARNVLAPTRRCSQRKHAHHIFPGSVAAPAIYDPANVEKFKMLQALNRVHLVTAVGTAHMYDAAMESRACRLTRRAAIRWRMAEAKRI
jgi:hypothetical protein